VRCASCSYVWTAEAEDPASLPTLEPAPVEAETAAPEPVEDKPVHTAYRERQAKKRQKMSLAVAGSAWGGLVAACAVLAITSWIFRVDIVTLWPRATSAYAAIGTEVNPYGISVGELTVSHEIDHGVPLLIIEGSVHNYDRRARQLPGLRAVLRDGHANTLLEWAVGMEGGPVAAGETREFRTIVSDPPPSTVEAEVLLVDAITEHLEAGGHAESAHAAPDHHEPELTHGSEPTAPEQAPPGDHDPEPTHSGDHH